MFYILYFDIIWAEKRYMVWTPDYVNNIMPPPGAQGISECANIKMALSIKEKSRWNIAKPAQRYQIPTVDLSNMITRI